jgi:hypothetical protein
MRDRRKLVLHIFDQYISDWLLHQNTELRRTSTSRLLMRREVRLEGHRGTDTHRQLCLKRHHRSDRYCTPHQCQQSGPTGIFLPRAIRLSASIVWRRRNISVEGAPLGSEPPRAAAGPEPQGRTKGHVALGNRVPASVNAVLRARRSVVGDRTSVSSLLTPKTDSTG